MVALSPWEDRDEPDTTTLGVTVGEQTTSRRAPRAWLALAGAAIALGGLPAPAAGQASDPPGGRVREVHADWHTLATPPLAEGQIELLTRSTLPDAVSGGDVLLAVRGLSEAQAEALVVTVDGRAVTDA
ncbi:MAG: hypothetical protein ACO1PW_02925, partial [Actinomycetota bacterium]